MLTLTSEQVTRAHGWPAGPKLLAVAVGTVVVFPMQDLRLLGAGLGALLLLHLWLGLGFAREAAGRLWLLWPFLLILGLWHLWLEDGMRGLAIALRMVLAVGIANLVTMTTRLDDMLAVMERILAPLARFGIHVRAIALAMALVIRFTPVLLDKAQQLRQAWQARSPRRPGVALVLPLALAALEDADHVAEALRARGGL